MKKIIIIPLMLALAACKTMPGVVSCDNADRVRAAAALAMQALDRACPIPGDGVY